jgi:DeoR/GlpR family transcriptional regulator of sugar metabolism
MHMSTDGLTKGDKARLRRKFILDGVRARGVVEDREIKEAGERQVFPTSPESLRQDAEEFDALGLWVRRMGTSFVSVSPEGRYWTYRVRRHENRKEKQAIGQLAKALLWGFEPSPACAIIRQELGGSLQYAVDEVGRLPAEFEKVTRRLLKDCQAKLQDSKLQAEIRTALMETAPNPDEHPYVPRTHSDAVKRVNLFLDDYWTKRHRVVALDSGTSTEAIARPIAKEDGPASHYSSLRVVTNSPRIERLLHSPDKSVDVIGIGGMLRKDTSARTGLLTEVCLKAWGIRFDVAIVGATGLLRDALDRPEAFACDSEDEARTKSSFLDSAGLKCIVMDSSKFKKQSSSSFAFCRVDPRFVDVIITDENITHPGKCEESLRWFRQRGIAVLRAKLSGPGLDDGPPEAGA